jgi:uncharacterized membrane protein YgcG
MNSLAFAIVVVKHSMSQTSSNRTLVSRHMAKSMSGSMLQQFWMPSIGQSSARLAVGMVRTAVVRVAVRATGSGDHKDDKKPRDGGKKSGSNEKKGGSNPQGGGSTGSGGTMMVMAVHEIAAKVCTI